MKRRPLSARRSRKLFRKNARSKKLNRMAPSFVSRGGIRM